MSEAGLCLVGGAAVTTEVGVVRLRQRGPPFNLIFFHGLGLEHIDMEVTDSHADWALGEGMVVSAHLQVPGDDHHRGWLEEIFLVTPHGGDPFFTWDHQPIPGDGAS